MFLKSIYFLLLLTLSAFWGFSQNNEGVSSNYRWRKIGTQMNPITIDSNSIVPNTLVVNGIYPDDYLFDPVNAQIFWKKEMRPDSVWIAYRVFPFKLNSIASNLNFDSIKYNFAVGKPITIRKGNAADRIIDFGNIQYNGSFGRGISFGNNQDAVVNSVMNLQLSGYIGDSIQLTAAISDNNIPIQPQGNTQDIRDFDRIFMQVKKKGWQASFGDIDIRQSRNYFLNFYKRLQGASFITDNNISNRVSNSLLVSGALSKGKFTRNIIAPLEGNQGPYKLYGANNELYFAVLAGTERVFIDGQLLTRGEDQDYVMDYNTAEITFTVKRLITRLSRIQVEFEYADRNFLSSMLYINDAIKISEKLRISMGAYSNTDAKNSSINQTLTDQQKQFLSTIGNRIEEAKYPNAQMDTFSVNKILYKKVDTVYNGIQDSIYVYSTNREDTLYSLSFTNVGLGKGDYVPANGDANGRVFKWVAPIDGKSQGEWEPVIFLITPKQHQIFTLAAEYVLNKNSFLKGEFAMSNYDVNTFSALEKENDKGIAAKVQYESTHKIFSSWMKGGALQTDISYEHVDKNFKPIEVLRNVEFNRDWGLPYFIPQASENLINGSVKIKDEENNFLGYQFTNYLRGQYYKGFRHSIENNITKNGWNIAGKFLFTSVDDSAQSGYFLRPSIDINKTIKRAGNINVGASYMAENNKQINKLFDTLMPISSSLDLWQVYIKSDEQKAAKWGINYTHATNGLPLDKNLVNTGISNNVTAMMELLNNEKRQFKLNVTYRDFDNRNNPKALWQNDKTLLGRAEYAFNEWKGLVTGSLLYEAGSGQEPRREYTYVEVPAGQGYYMWIDYNNDGIPQLNEFEVAIYPDQKKWVRIFTPSGEVVKANYIQFNYNVGVNPSAVLSRQATGMWVNLIKRFSSASSLQVNKKQESSGSFLLNPFTNAINDTSLISLYSFLSNTLYFNRRSSVWGMDLTHRLNNFKSLLNYGFESNSRRDVMIKARWNLNKSFAALLANTFSKNQLATPAFANRNYLIKQVLTEPSVSYIFKSFFRVNLIYSYEKKENTIGAKEHSLNNKVTAEMRYNSLSKGSVNGRFSLNNISFTGMPNSTVGYMLLDGLLPGRNYLWNIEFTRKLPGNLELNLQYEGRKPGENPSIHTGRASLRAIF